MINKPMTQAELLPATELNNSQEKMLVVKNFRLQNGFILPEMHLAYITLGRLSADGKNAILLTHGFTSSHRLSKANNAEASEGGWQLLVGPDKPIDTNKYFVISSNMLGSSYGSTGPKSIDPSTNKPYGLTFPKISFSDIVKAQYELVTQLGVRHLRAIVGASYGGFQAFQWAVDYPEMVSGIVAAMSSLWAPNDGLTVESLKLRFERDPNWHGGDFYDRGSVTDMMTELRIEMLREYGAESGLTARGVTSEDMPNTLRELALPWAQQFDPNSLLVLLRAAKDLSLADKLQRIRAKVLYLLSSSDRLFPPEIATSVTEALHQAGVDITYRLIDSNRGHRASHEDAAKWSSDLKNFLKIIA